MIIASSSAPIMMLAGFRSRWTTPALCASTSPATTAASDAQDVGEQAAVPSRLRIDDEVGALDVRHRDVLDAVDLAEVVNADDVLVRDLAREQQLALEAALDFRRGRRIRHHLRTDDLDRDGDAEFGVPRLVDRTHAADAEQSDDVIAGPERLAHRRAGRISPEPRRGASRAGYRRGRVIDGPRGGRNGVRVVASGE